MKADAARAICKELERVDKVTCGEAIYSLIQAGPLMPSDKEAILDSIIEKVSMDFVKDSSDNDVRLMDDTANNQTQLFHHTENDFTAAEWDMIPPAQLVASGAVNQVAASLLSWTQSKD